MYLSRDATIKINDLFRSLIYQLHMSDEKIKHISDEKRKKNGSIKDAIRRARQRIRNVETDNLEEPEGFAFGDMDKFVEDPDEYEKEDDDERDPKK